MRSWGMNSSLPATSYSTFWRFSVIGRKSHRKIRLRSATKTSVAPPLTFISSDDNCSAQALRRLSAAVLNEAFPKNRW